MSRSPPAELGLTHIVVTSVDRDDLPTAAPASSSRVIEALRRNAATTIEILHPRFPQQGEAAVETDHRGAAPTSTTTISRRCRGSIRHPARRALLCRRCGCWRASSARPSIFTKSGVMVGLGEQRLEVHQVMDDMRSADVDFLTMGQYLQPTQRHARVEEFVTPQAFAAYAAIARAKGFLLVAASPLTRSSYHAGDDFEKMRAAREAKLARRPLTCRANSEKRICPTRRSSCSTSSPTSEAIRSSCPGWRRRESAPTSETEMVADLVVGFKGAEGNLHLASVQETPGRDRDRLYRGAAQVSPQHLEIPARRGGSAPSLISASISPFRSRIFETIAGQMFDRALRRMIGAFEDRAHALYGAGASGSSNSSAQSAA
jgi:hypothetical protein